MPTIADPDGRADEAAGRCPRCGTASVNVQGLADCPDCSWTGGVGRC